MHDCLFMMRTRLCEVYDNFPNRTLGRLLKTILFPPGTGYRPADDALVKRAANVILRWGSARERLTGGLYLSGDENDPLACLEAALEKATAAQPVLANLRDAMRSGQLASGDPELSLVEAVSLGIIDERAAARVRAAVAARQRVIGVDEFAANYWKEDQHSWQQAPTHAHQAGRFI
jgi:acyl-CoA dehydrogenase